MNGAMKSLERIAMEQALGVSSVEDISCDDMDGEYRIADERVPALHRAASSERSDERSQLL